ncbi:Uncharacterised protein [Fusicatenibacter saccharivorans]|uniref:CRESS-DNA virus Rep endonuclease domain-containing protein n=1 Tax=Fusicatenibacter saccharivorans TaxID=1150298 RepID=A0A174G7K6_9FIRM|nr:hypothetical protein [Fusicatenibacter saccharivorans]CUO57637.1 Uncharacterised protein [Fusicatenibacter saccharivorans]
MANDTVSRSWFAVLPYPEKIYKGSPEEILEQMKQQWIGDNPLKKGHWAYCISKEGMPHVHMVLEGSVSMRFSAVRKCYGKAHLEPTRGSRKMVLQYIHKRGKFAEKGERVVCFVSYGNIEGNKTKTLINQNAILDRIEELIEDGKTPNEIMGEDIRLRKEETLVRKAFFAKRYRETPPYRKVTVVWHLGESGSGKTFSYTKLCESRGEEEIYFCAEYANKGVGAFDLYSGEKILFLDEIRSTSLPYETLLTLIGPYRTQIHCRYANAFALWEEVHICSILAPEDLYKGMVKSEERERDCIQQLLRRINKYVYHYKEGNKYKTVEVEAKRYTSYEELKYSVKKGNEFSYINETNTPFREEKDE